jgi:transposase
MAHANTMDTQHPGVAATEGGRRPTGVAATPGRPTSTPDALPVRSDQPSDLSSEVLSKPERRRFTKAYKLDILRQIDACSGVGQIGALPRREGLYSSHLANWRNQRSQGLLQHSGPKKRASKPANPNATRVRQLERDNARLQARLKQAELVLDIQKKASEILAIPLNALANEGSDL